MKKLLIVLFANIILLSCSSGDDSSGSNGEKEITFDSDSFLEDVKEIFSSRNNTTANSLQVSSVRPSAASSNDILSAFGDAWKQNISTLENSDSLMGFINDNISLILGALESSEWSYDTEGHLTINAEGETIDAFSTPLTVSEGKAAKLHFYFNELPASSFGNLDYKTADAMYGNVDGHFVLILSETETTKKFFWVEMSKYADRSSSSWDASGDDYVIYKRESSDTPVILPSVNRDKDAASGGRAVLFVVDKTEKEIYFEHLTSTEKHNRQEHYIIRLADLDESGSKLVLGGDSRINYSRVRRAYFGTNVGQSVDLVNDQSDDTKLVWDIMQGSITNGMKYKHKSEDANFDDCIKLGDDLNPDDVATGLTDCSSGDLSIPPITSDFNFYIKSSGDKAYLPTAGSTYQNIDLRVNLHAIYTEEYDPGWIKSLPVD